MPQINFTLKYRKNTGRIISASDLKSLTLYGFSILAKDGTDFPDENIEFYIESAQQEIEKFLGVKFLRQLVTETQHFYREDYMHQFPSLYPNYQIRQPLSLVGLLGKAEQIVYPPEWLGAYRSNLGTNAKTMSMVPTGATSIVGNQDVILSGMSAQIGLQRFKFIPNYWTIQYETGYNWDEMPMDLIEVVLMLASVPLLDIAGDLILGAGIASQSLSIDGLSQSISSTSSATNAGLGARIISYQKQIKDKLDKLKTIYKRVRTTVV